MISDALAGLPEPGDRRVAVRVTPDALRQIRGGSPWVFDRSITSAGGTPSSGDLAVVFDDRRAFAAIGLWDPDSPIRVLLLHTGSPRPIDDEFWHERVASAVARRSSLIDDPTTDAYRLVHGENDGFGALVIDQYADTSVVKLYSRAWLPHFTAVLEALVDVVSPTRVVVRFARNVDVSDVGLRDGVVVHGPAIAGPIRIRERGLRMEVDVVAGHKTGHFLDQRDNRAMVRSMAAGAEVLDVFSSTGGFALAAAAGGARSVELVDVSAPALEAALRNLHANRDLPTVRACEVSAICSDAFEALDGLARRRRRFDLVVVDPPSFASTARQVPRAVRAYGRLTAGALAVLRDGGTLVQASCSSRVGGDELEAAMHRAAERCGRRLDVIRRTGHPVDHPIGFEQGAYLDAIVARASPR